MLWKHRRFKLFAISDLPYLLSIPLGTLALERFGREVWLKQLLGVLFLCIAGFQLIQRRLTKPSAVSTDLESLSPRVVLAIVVTYIASGLMRGLFGVAGPPVMVLLLFFYLDPPVWRCLSAMCRVTLVLIQGAMFGDHGDFDT